VHLIYIIPPVAGIALAAAIGWLIERHDPSPEGRGLQVDSTGLRGPVSTSPTMGHMTLARDLIFLAAFTSAQQANPQ
jgi:hypothetical protein